MRILLLAALLAGCAAETSNAVAPSVAEQTATGRIGSHGMVVAGSPADAVLSHIPMFGAPHDVQLIASGSFEGDGVPASFDDRLYTFLPDRMSLDALRTGTLHELHGTLFLGNFEAGGRPVPGSATFVVRRVVHEHVLDAKETAPDLTYFLVGSRAQTYAIHRIAGAPSFDEIVRIDLGTNTPSDADLRAGVERTFPARLGLQPGVTTISCLAGPDFVSECP